MTDRVMDVAGRSDRGEVDVGLTGGKVRGTREGGRLCCEEGREGGRVRGREGGRGGGRWWVSIRWGACWSMEGGGRGGAGVGGARGWSLFVMIGQVREEMEKEGREKREEGKGDVCVDTFHF
jgi:hypothetical protein